MGHHADGVVFWGYDLGDMTDRETWETTAPAWLVNDEGATYRHSDDELAARLGWDEQRRSYEERSRILAEAGIGVTLEHYGYLDGGETTWYVAIDGSETTATYDCQRLDFTVQTDWRERIDRFIELLELPKPDGEPGWFVTSNYG